MRTLICSFPRSGTKYISEVMKKCNKDIRHERWGQDGIATWMIAGLYIPVVTSVEELDVKLLQHQVVNPLNNVNFDVTLHQVRNPLKAIASAKTITVKAAKYIVSHIDIELPVPSYALLMEAWIQWNTMCDARSTYTYQVEKINESWPIIRTLLEIDRATPPVVAEGKLNSRSHSEITLEDLKKIDAGRAHRLELLAAYYGYELS